MLKSFRHKERKKVDGAAIYRPFLLNKLAGMSNLEFPQGWVAFFSVWV